MTEIDTLTVKKELSKYPMLDFVEYQNKGRTTRIAITKNRKTIAEINKPDNICCKAATVRIAELYKNKCNNFEYKTAVRYDNPFVFNHVDICCYLSKIQDKIDEIVKYVNNSMEDREATLKIMNEFLGDDINIPKNPIILDMNNYRCPKCEYIFKKAKRCPECGQLLNIND